MDVELDLDHVAERYRADAGWHRQVDAEVLAAKFAGGFEASVAGAAREVLDATELELEPLWPRWRIVKPTDEWLPSSAQRPGLRGRRVSCDLQGDDELQLVTWLAADATTAQRLAILTGGPGGLRLVEGR